MLKLSLLVLVAAAVDRQEVAQPPRRQLQMLYYNGQGLVPMPPLPPAPPAPPPAFRRFCVSPEGTEIIALELDEYKHEESCPTGTDWYGSYCSVHIANGRTPRFYVSCVGRAPELFTTEIRKGVSQVTTPAAEDTAAVVDSTSAAARPTYAILESSGRPQQSDKIGPEKKRKPRRRSKPYRIRTRPVYSKVQGRCPDTYECVQLYGSHRGMRSSGRWTPKLNPPRPMPKIACIAVERRGSKRYELQFMLPFHGTRRAAPGIGQTQTAASDTTAAADATGTWRQGNAIESPIVLNSLESSIVQLDAPESPIDLDFDFDLDFDWSASLIDSVPLEVQSIPSEMAEQMRLESQSVPLETTAAAADEQFEPADTTFMLETADQQLATIIDLQGDTAQQTDLQQQLQHTTANELVWVDTEWPFDVSFDDSSYNQLPTALFNDHHGHHPGSCR